MKLVKRVLIQPTKKQAIILGSMCKSAAKLWNVANYEKKNYKELGFEKYPNWYEQKKRLKINFWYKNLPSQTAQELLNVLERSWKSFFKLKETGGIENPQPPRFKRKGSKCNIRYLNKGFQTTDSGIRFSIPAQQRKYLEETYQIEAKYMNVKVDLSLLDLNMKQIEFKPLENGKYEMLIIYEVEDVKPLCDNGRYLSIDIGMSNLMTCYDNHNNHSFIISGKQWLSISRYFDKKIAHYQEISDRQQSALGVKYPKKTKRVKQLYKKRHGQLHHLLHCATRQIADYCKEHGICKVVLGDIKNIREDANFGSVNNQKLHRLPFKKLEDLLSYKLTLIGVSLEKQKECYSSQCSPFSKGVSKKYAKKSNRRHRGLYKDGVHVFNSDSVGAFNIMRLYLKKTKKVFELPTNRLSSPKTYKFNQNSKYLCNPTG